MNVMGLSALLFGVSVLVADAAFADGDAAAGAGFFRSRCTSCHTTDKGGVNKIGPNLFGIYGRKAGLASGYSYSSAMQASGIVWTSDKLKTFLANPRRALPGTKMIYAGISNDKDNANLIAYLATLK